MKRYGVPAFQWMWFGKRDRQYQPVLTVRVPFAPGRQVEFKIIQGCAPRVSILDWRRVGSPLVWSRDFFAASQKGNSV